MKKLPLLPLALTAGVVLFLVSKYKASAASSQVISSVNPDGSFAPEGFTPPDVNPFKIQPVQSKVTLPSLQPIQGSATSIEELALRKIHGG